MKTCAFCGREFEKSAYKNCCRLKCKVAWNQDNKPLCEERPSARKASFQAIQREYQGGYDG